VHYKLLKVRNFSGRLKQRTQILRHVEFGMVLDGGNLEVRSLANENETYELKFRNMVRMRIFEIITILTWHCYKNM